MLVGEALSFLGGICENSLTFIAERKIDRSRRLYIRSSVCRNCLSEAFHGSFRFEQFIRDHLVFPQKPQQQMLRLDVLRSKLAGFVAREEDRATGFFGVALKHNSPASKTGNSRRSSLVV